MTRIRILRLLAWTTLFAVVAVTLSPIGLRPRFPLPADLERAMAYLAVGLLFAIAYPRHAWLALALLVVGLFGLEWLQELRPDRHGRFSDAMVKTIGALIGVGAGWVATRLIDRPARTYCSTGGTP